VSSAAEKKGKKTTEVTGATQMVKGTRRQQAQVIGQNTPKMQDIPDGKIYFTNRFFRVSVCNRGIRGRCSKERTKEVSLKDFEIKEHLATKSLSNRQFELCGATSAFRLG